MILMLAAPSSRLSDATLQSLKSPFTLHTHVCNATRQRGTGGYIIYAFRFFKPKATHWYASLFHETCEKVCMPACCCLHINKTLKRCSFAYKFGSLWLTLYLASHSNPSNPPLSQNNESDKVWFYLIILVPKLMAVDLLRINAVSAHQLLNNRTQ